MVGAIGAIGIAVPVPAGVTCAALATAFGGPTTDAFVVVGRSASGVGSGAGTPTDVATDPTVGLVPAWLADVDVGAPDVAAVGDPRSHVGAQTPAPTGAPETAPG